jgi:hypothetical protein
MVRRALPFPGGTPFIAAPNRIKVSAHTHTLILPNTCSLEDNASHNPCFAP